MPYSPQGLTGQTVALLAQQVQDELLRLGAVVNAIELGRLDKTDVAPTKPRDGDIRYADGTNWNPGGGAGIYWFNGTVWTKL